MGKLNVLRIKFEKLAQYKNGTMEINFCASDRVSKKEQVYEIIKSIYTQKVISFVGINASGKTSALKLIEFALQIIVDNENLNTTGDGLELIQDGTILTADFIYDNKVYEWMAVIGKQVENEKKPTFYFINETLKNKPINRIKVKKDIFIFDKKCDVTERNKLTDDHLKYLKDGESILLGVTRDNDTTVEQLLRYTNINLFISKGKQAPEIIKAFDSSIESLSCEGESTNVHYELKFKNKEMIEIADPLDLSKIVSSGTIKGQNLMKNAINVLHTGGYLIVDELENHFNKEIVKMIIDIFKNKNTNPLGACLIFSTHYIEILDFIDRKDNIYVTRKTDELLIEVLNYAEHYKRADVKKSEVIFSNLIKGTAPRYENIKQLKQFLWSKK